MRRMAILVGILGLVSIAGDLIVGKRLFFWGQDGRIAIERQESGVGSPDGSYTYTSVTCITSTPDLDCTALKTASAKLIPAFEADLARCTDCDHMETEELGPLRSGDRLLIVETDPRPDSDSIDICLIENQSLDGGVHLEDVPARFMHVALYYAILGVEKDSVGLVWHAYDIWYDPERQDYIFSWGWNGAGDVGTAPRALFEPCTAADLATFREVLRTRHSLR